jgi:sec-independent protein translocase protein TatA
MPNIGPLEIIVVLIIALVVLGPRRLPEFGRSVGKGMREFKGALTGREGENRSEERLEDRSEERVDERSEERVAEGRDGAPATPALSGSQEPHR